MCHRYRVVVLIWGRKRKNWIVRKFFDLPEGSLSYGLGFQGHYCCRDFHKCRTDWFLRAVCMHFLGHWNIGFLGTRMNRVGRIHSVICRWNQILSHGSTRIQTFQCCHGNHRSVDFPTVQIWGKNNKQNVRFQKLKKLFSFGVIWSDFHILTRKPLKFMMGFSIPLFCLTMILDNSGI